MAPSVSASNPASFSVPVLIAGGGPVGLSLGHTLAHFGIPFLLVERNPATTMHPKMDLTNARSMELFARMGAAGLLREAGVPDHHEMVIRYATSMGSNARQLHTFDYPSVDRKRQLIRQTNDGTQAAEPPLRVSQAVLEPTLKQALQSLPGCEVRYGWALESCRDEGDHVSATVREAATGRTQQVRCDWLAGCDGAHSVARTALGITLEGQSGLRPSYMVHFRSRALDVMQRWGVTWHRRLPRATIIAQDDKETWTLQYRILSEDEVPKDPQAFLDQLLGDIGAEVIVANAWRANLLVADRFGSGRIWLAGDAVHQFVPTGGYGMNTGVADAFDLGWKLAAVLQGWGGAQLLPSYEAERRPVALEARAASGRHVKTRQDILQVFQDAGAVERNTLEDDTPAGEALRQQVAARLAAIGNVENESYGVEYGYRYESAIVAREEGPPPAFDPLRYVPSTWPGMRLPSTVLPDGRLLYERLGPWFTLVAFGDAQVGDVETQAAALRMPVAVLRLPDVQPGAIYGRRLLLVRPDHHVAWRGDAAPAQWAEVLGRACGR